MAIATQVKERPILFSGPMVRKILAGEKTQTRRVMKPQPTRGEVVDPEFDHRGHMTFSMGWHWDPTHDHHHIWHDHEDQNEGDWAPWFLSMCPYGQSGDRLWVRETFARRLDVDPDVEPEKARHYALYRANGTGLDEPHWHLYPDRWTPSIHMPRWASRLTLEITAVRVERLQEISEADALAEGGWTYGTCPIHKNPERSFAELWNSINGKRPGCSWEASPWVWCLTFRRLD